MADGPTPAMKQFYEIKARYPDTIVFFQMGDFYETFGHDAEIVSRELGIVLTSRGKDRDGNPMPLAGVPVHAGASYISRLVGRGYRVALCEQVEEKGASKGVVKRDVVRVITPGTVMDPGMVTSPGARYLMAVAGSGVQRWGTAFLDITTGEFFVSEYEDGQRYDRIVSEVVRYRPSECIAPQGTPADLLTRIRNAGVVTTTYREDAFEPGAARRLLCGHFHVASLGGYGCTGMDAATAAAGAALAYARETQHSDLDHITGLATRTGSECMHLDAITLRNLEITQHIRSGDESGSTLMNVLNLTETAMGSRTLHSFLLRPLISKSAIEARLDAVEYFTSATRQRAALRGHLHKCADIERIAGRIAYGNAGPRDLAALKKTLELVPEMKALFEGDIPPLIAEVLGGMHELRECTSLIGSALVDEPPALAHHGGMIRQGYSRALDELRETSDTGKTWIADLQVRERERTDIKSLKIGYNRVFGYYIEVTKANLRLVPPEYIKRQTTAGGERYTIPDLSEREAVISRADEQIEALEQQLYTELVQALAARVPALQETSRSLGHLDTAAALAEAAVRGRYTRPVITTDTKIIIRDGRHPVVESSLETDFVPNDTDIDSGRDQILIITGANMAGKSTYMRAVAHICIMAQAGSFVPASHATIGIVDRIFTRIGAFDDLASGQSTFMVEMLELANILNNTTTSSLVILDEIGRGTSTLDGYCIARSVLEYLHGKGGSGPRTLFATHFHELVGIERELKRVRNYHFAVKDTGKDVIFLRQIIPGATDKSYGIHVAMLAGIPRKVTERAKTLMKDAAGTGYRPAQAPVYTQMLLMSEHESQPPPSPLAEELKHLDLDTMTPIQAFNKLCELKEKSDEEEEQR